MNNFKKLIAVLLTITAPVWILPTIIIGLMVYIVVSMYESFANILGVNHERKI